IGHCAAEDLNVLHLPGHNRFLHSFVFEETNHATKLADAHPLHALGVLVHRRIGLLANGSDDERHTRLARAFHDHKRKLAVARNQSEFHLVTPRLEPSMKRSRSETSGEPVISCWMRSTACVVLSLAESSRWKA